MRARIGLIIWVLGISGGWAMAQTPVHTVQSTASDVQSTPVEVATPSTANGTSAKTAATLNGAVQQAPATQSTSETRQNTAAGIPEKTRNGAPK